MDVKAIKVVEVSEFIESKEFPHRLEFITLRSLTLSWI
jgi:hypothetical protein